MHLLQTFMCFVFKMQQSVMQQSPHTQDHMRTCTHRWGKRHFLSHWNLPKMNDSFFPSPSVRDSIVPVRPWIPSHHSWFSCCSRKLNPTSAVSRQSQKQENQCSGEVLKCEIVARNCKFRGIKNEPITTTSEQPYKNKIFLPEKLNLCFLLNT